MSNKHKQSKQSNGPSVNGSSSQTVAVDSELALLRAEKQRLDQDNFDLRGKLQPYLEIVDKAKQEAEEWLQSIKLDEVRIREESKRDEELKLEQLRKTGQEEANQLRSDARSEAERIRRQAEAESENILGAARKNCADLTTKAQRDIAEAEEQIAAQRYALEEEYADSARQALEQLRKDQREISIGQDSLTTREKAIHHDEQRLAVLRDDLEFDLGGIQLRRAELEERWNECSPDRLWMLERNLESERRKAESMAGVITDLQAQCDRFRRDQENMAGRSAGALLVELESFRVRSKEISDRFAGMPSDQELSVLRKDAAELRIVREQRDDLDRRLRSHAEAASRLDLGLRELTQVKMEADSLRILNDELQNQIELNSKALTQRTGSCFPELLRIDSERRQRTAIGQFNTTNLLITVVDHVRAYAASLAGKPLYYSEMDIRAFLAGLAASPLMILQGLSGTGKTSLPCVFADAISGEYRKISVQSNWRDRHELLGYYNDFNKRFTETEFTQALYTAALPSEEDVPWFIVLDELNLARVEYYFADFLSVLEEQDKTRWLVELMSFDPTAGGASGPAHLYQNRMLEIPGNVWFIGTANQDESTFEITDKVYDRAQVLDFRQRHSKNGVAGPSIKRRLTRGDLTGAFEGANAKRQNQLNDDELKFLESLDNLLLSLFDVTFGNRILDQIKCFVPVYVGCGGKKSEAFDIQFARKILRKLEGLHEKSAVPSLERLANELETVPRGWERLITSGNAIERIKKNCG